MDVLLAVNGTLMRGIELDANLLAAHVTYVRETRTAPVYRPWSIGDRHPAMVHVAAGGVAVAGEHGTAPGWRADLQARGPGSGRFSSRD